MEREKPTISKIPWRGPQPLGFAVCGKIYLRHTLWEDYISGDPNAQTLSIIKHEETHVERLGKKLKPHFVFWLDKEFRFQEELAAITEEMKVLKKHGEVFNIEKRAKNLSGVAYLWCTDFETAKGKMEDVWNNI